MDRWNYSWLFDRFVGDVNMRGSLSIFQNNIDARLFKIFLLLGILTGIFLGNLSVSASPSYAPKKLQQNFLIALVENAEVEASPLLALWLVAGHIDGGEFSWIPIYPQPLTDKNASNNALIAPLVVNPNDLQAWQNNGLVQEKAIWWDEVIVLDMHALTDFLNLLPSEGNAFRASALLTNQNPLYEQVRIIQQICGQSRHFNNPEALNQILALKNLATHLISTLNSFEIISIWDKLANRQFELDCSHPWAD